MNEHEFVVTDIEYSEPEEDYDSMEEKEFCVKLTYEFRVMSVNDDEADDMAREMMLMNYQYPDEVYIKEI